MNGQLNNEKNKYNQRDQTVYGHQFNIAGNVGDNVKIELPPIQPTAATAPAPPTDFVGREEQLTQLTAMLSAGKSAAITALHGMGGIGKTALAQQLAERLKPDFPGGIFWGDLALHGGSAETILRAWGAICGEDFSQEPDPAVLSERLRGLLAMRQEEKGALLAVLDDVRSEWLPAAQLLQKSLPAGTPLLVTMREVDLAVTLAAEVVRLDVLPEVDAHDLLAARVKPKEILTPEETVKALLKHLGYLPLAIRLAAGYVSKFARKPSFELGQFVDDVVQRAVSLLDVARGAGLAATFAISYDALSEEQQRVFRYCSVYSAPLLTVEHMAGLLGIDTAAVEATLDSLVDVALLDWDQEVAGRYLLHPLLGQYSDEGLQRHDDAPTLHRQAAEHLRDKIRDTKRGGTPDELLEEVDQWEKAKAWQEMAHSVLTLMNHLNQIGNWIRIAAKLEKVNQKLERSQENRALTACLSQALGIMCTNQGKWKEAILHYEASRQVFRELRNYVSEGNVLNELGYSYRRNRQFDKAATAYEMSQTVFKKLDDDGGQGRALYGLGIIRIRCKKLPEALAILHGSLEMLRKTNDLSAMGETLLGLGRAYRMQARWQDAIDVHEDALRIYRDRDDWANTGKALNRLSLVFSNQGKWQEAKDLLNESLKIYQSHNDLAGKGNTLSYLGRIDSKQKRWEQARAKFIECLGIFRDLDDRYDEGKTLYYLGEVYEGLGKRQDAIVVWHEARTKLHPASQRYQRLGEKLERLENQAK